MARLTKEQIKDRSRYQFETEDVPLPELGWGDDATVEVKTLSVKERDALPDMTETTVTDDGKTVVKVVATVDDLAATFAAMVSDPKVTVEEAKGFVGDLPSDAFDRVAKKFGELVGDKDDTGKDDGSSSADS